MKILIVGNSLVKWEAVEEAFAEFGEVEKCLAEESSTLESDAEILITNSRLEVGADLLDRLPKVKYIGALATGYNNIDLKECAAREITVCNVPSYSTHSVAQTVFALLLELTQNIGYHSEVVKAGKWMDMFDAFYETHPLIELHGKILGILGLGEIGIEVARIGRAFGMNVISHTRSDKSADFEWIDFVERDELFQRADVLTLHTPLTQETEGLVNLELLKQMKQNAFLINTSRGAIIVEDDLAEALNTGLIAGAGLDVLCNEPPNESEKILSSKNCVISPHIAFACRESKQRLVQVAVENLRHFLQNAPVNVVKFR